MRRAAALACLALLAPAGASERPPNILLVLADDLGWGEIGAHGQRIIRTPTIDRLAAEGMRFDQAYSGSPVCAPSRCVLLTGLHTGHAVVRGNTEVGGWGPDDPEGQRPLPAETLTLAELLRERGLATGAFGKWGLGGPGSSGHPCYQGFDRFYGYLCQRVAHNYYPTHLWSNHDVDVLDGNRWFSAHQRLDEAPESYARFSGEVYAPDRMLEEATEFVRANAERPFFLYYPTPVPHAALQVPADSLADYAGHLDEEPYLGRQGYLPHPEPRAAYAAMVTRLDRDVGTLLDLLDELELARDTLVIFTSDNGPTFNGGTDSDFFESRGPWREGKTTVYEGGLRVPFLVRWPGRVAPGSVSGHQTAFQDLLPTLVEAAGGTPPPGLDGLSLLPVLLGQEDAPTHDFLYWEYPERDGQMALLRGDWKLVRRNLRGREGTEPRDELYHLPSDPGETTSLHAERPDLVAELRALALTARVPNPDFPLPVLDAESAGER